MTTTPDDLLDFLNVDYNATMSMAQKHEQAATEDNSSVWTGVGAGVVGAAAAAALFVACGKKSATAANEEAFLRA